MNLIKAVLSYENNRWLMRVIYSLLFSLIPMSTNAFETGGVIYNSTDPAEQVIAMGLRPEGHMGAPWPHDIVANASYTGIAYKFPADAASFAGTWQDATTPGCLCEGWGAGGKVAGAKFHGRANQSSGGVNNLAVKNFVTTDTSLTSTVWINDSLGNPMLEVTHQFGPSTNEPSTLFQALVTITNISGNTVTDVRYNRTMDWDIPPTIFSELVSIYGSELSAASPHRPRILFSGDNGFMRPNVWSSSGAYTRSTELNKDVIRNGPSDHGYAATFELGDLICGEAHTFMIYYGAGATAAIVKTALESESVPLYSIGESNPSASSDIAYGFGFKGVSGSAIAPSLPVKTAILPGGVETDESIIQSYAPPAVVGEYLYQATFKYHLDKQWEGDIKRYSLDDEGTIIHELPVSANGKLKTRLDSAGVWTSYSGGGRSIWTVGNDTLCSGGMLIKGVNNNNFVLDNEEKLNKLLFSCSTGTDPTASDVISFVRGLNVTGESSVSLSAPRTYILGDTFHSEIISVGPPRAGYSSDEEFSKSESAYRFSNGYAAFASANQHRAMRLYVGANDGMLHSFDKDLNEVWAFIPPSVLPKLRTMFGEDGTSNSVFNVDGPITVKDIYIESEDTWKTVLMGGLGWGGKSYYALDVTDPNNPQHMFTINNDDTAKEVQYWDSSGTLTRTPYLSAPSHMDYSKIGSTWSRPIIMLLPYIGDDASRPQQRWVAVFGAGYGGGASSGYGPYVYVVNFEPNSSLTPPTTGGDVLEMISVPDDAMNNIPNGVTAHLTAVTADGTSLANYYGAIVYFTDLQGKLWKLDLEKTSLSSSDESELFALTKQFETEGSLSNDRFGYNQLATTVVGDGVDYHIMNYFGTGDQTRIQRRISSIKNRIYAVKDITFPTGHDDSGLDTFKTISDTEITDFNSGTCDIPLGGWWSDIKSKTNLSSDSFDWQKVIGRAALYQKNLFFSAYRPENTACPRFGTSEVIEIVDGCGEVVHHLVGKGLATAPVIDGRGNIYIGISNLPETEIIGGDGYQNVTKIGEAASRTGGVKYKSWREIRY